MLNSKKILSIILKSIFMGIIHILLTFILKTIVFGTTHYINSETIGEIVTLFSSGFIIGIVYGVVANQIDIRRTIQIIIWSLIIFINSCTVIIEGVFYSNTDINILKILIQQIFSAIILAISISLLFVQKDGHKSVRTKLNKPILNVLILPVLFIVLYLISGSINYFFFTDVFYGSMQDFVEPTNPLIIIVIEYINGVLMIVSLLPLLILARREKKLYVICGLILFVSGGVIPIIQNSTYTMMFILLTLAEIFIQKFIYGYVSAKILVKTKVKSR